MRDKKTREGEFFLVLVLFLAVTVFSPCARGEVIEAIAAVVNDDIILLSRVDERATPILAAAQKQSASLSKSFGPAEQEQLLKRVVAEMVDELLIGEQAAKMRIRISSDEVNRAMKNMAASNNLSWPDFVRALQAQGYDVAQYRSELRKQLLRMKVVQTKLAGRLRVSDREIKTFYVRQVRGARAGDRCKLSHILVEVPQSSGAAKLASYRRRAKAILARVEAGAPFAALAERYSDDRRTAKKGGSLGWIYASELPEDVRDVVLGLGAGEVSSPIRTAKGFRLVKVLEWEASQVRPFEEAREAIRMQLLERQMAKQERVWLTELRRKAYIDVRLWRE